MNWLRASDWLIAGASPLVPHDIRQDWVREWRAELHYSAARRARGHRLTTAAGLLLLARTCGSFAHAIWLRWDRWRLEMLLQDLRYALRTLGRKPGFAVITVLTLALGIGANAAIFSAVRAVLLRPMPFPEPDQLVGTFSTSVRNPDRTNGSVSPPDFNDWRNESRSFAELAAISANALALTGQGAAEQIPGAYVTGGFFTVLGVPALHGRALLPADDAAGAGEVAVIGRPRRAGSSARYCSASSPPTW